ncbi:hypothetical protein FOL47_001923 [Perkinsus chesapeaki]|uniref:Uncharacterized protein n=1 Tax=Perkinsus chesapeaki TaxID=330153 RepID=A0A7J6MHC9_PERCH|nr:hypothetical protein FOL47_001923 [Perkinsus chesapeaki]
MSDTRTNEDTLVGEINTSSAAERLSPGLTRQVLSFCEANPEGSDKLMATLASQQRYDVLDRLCTRGAVDAVAKTLARTGGVLRLSAHNTRRCAEIYLLHYDGDDTLASLIGAGFSELATAHPTTAQYFQSSVWQQNALTTEQAVALADYGGPDVFLPALGKLWSGPLLPVMNTMAITVAIATLLRYRPGPVDEEVSQSLLDGVHNRLSNADPDQRAMAMALMEVVARKVWATNSRVFPDSPGPEIGFDSWCTVWKAGMGEEWSDHQSTDEAHKTTATPSREEEPQAHMPQIKSRLVEALADFEPLPALRSASEPARSDAGEQGAWLAACDTKLAAPTTNEPVDTVDGNLPGNVTLGNLVIARASSHEGPLEERLRIESALSLLPAAINKASAAELRRVGPTTIYNLITHSHNVDSDSTHNTARHLAGRVVAKDCLENPEESKCLRYVLQCVEKADWAVGTRAEALKVLVEASTVLAGRDNHKSNEESEKTVGRSLPENRTRRRMCLKEFKESGKKSNRWSQGQASDEPTVIENRFVSQWLPRFIHPVLAYSQSKRCQDQPVLLAEALRTASLFLQSAGASGRSSPFRQQIVEETIDVVQCYVSHQEATVRKACMMLSTCVFPLVDPSELDENRSAFLRFYMNRASLAEPDDRTREQAQRLRDLVN